MKAYVKIFITDVVHDQNTDMIHAFLSAEIQDELFQFAIVDLDFQHSSTQLDISDRSIFELFPFTNPLHLTMLVLSKLHERTTDETAIAMCPDCSDVIEIEYLAA